MKRATAPQLRQSLELANALVKQGIRFVPLPVATEEEFEAAFESLSDRLEKMAQDCEKEARPCTQSPAPTAGLIR